MSDRGNVVERIAALADNVDRVEHSIRPPMHSAVTVPLDVTIDGRRRCLAVYVAQSPFGSDQLDDDQLAAVAWLVAGRINVKGVGA